MSQSLGKRGRETMNGQSNASASGSGGGGGYLFVGEDSSMPSVLAPLQNQHPLILDQHRPPPPARNATDGPPHSHAQPSPHEEEAHAHSHGHSHGHAHAHAQHTHRPVP